MVLPGILGALGIAAILVLALLRPWAGEGLPAGKVAVLPFTTLSDLEQDTHLAAGLHSQILTQFQKIDTLDVISNQSVQEYRGSPKNLRTIGRELGARYIGVATVWRAADSVRVDFQLVDAETDRLLWSETFDRQLSSVGPVFSVTTAIARSVASKLQAVITPEEETALHQVQTDNPEAYDRYLRGLGHFEVGRTTSSSQREDFLRAAVDLLREAVRLDPGFGLAYAALSEAHLRIWWGGDRSQARKDLARNALDRAVELAPDLGETHFTRGLFLYQAEWDLEGAIGAFEASRQRMPSDSRPDEYIAYVMRRQGRFRESAKLLEKAVPLNPRQASPAIDLCRTYVTIRDSEKAVLWGRRAADLGAAQSAPVCIARAHLMKGRVDKARAALSEAREWTSGVILTGFKIETYARDYDVAASWLDRAPGPILEGDRVHAVAGYRARLQLWGGDQELARDSFREAAVALRAMEAMDEDLAVAYAGLGERDEAQAVLDSIFAGRERLSDLYWSPLPFNQMATVWVLLGEYDTAVDILEQLLGMEYGDALTVHDLRLDPTWDPLRDHPRFQALLNL
jgi:serine/threonine-protein kinase